MSIAFQTRALVETALAHKNPAALTPTQRAPRNVMPSGFAFMDEVLGGGLPCGCITELVGTSCSGKTTAALAYVAVVTGAGNVCAWVDVNDALDLESATAHGVDLERLLWVRCATRQGPTVQATPETTKGVLSSAATAQPRHTGGGSPHPRSEGRDMPEAISAMLQAHGGLYDKQARREKRMIGTPGAPNRPLSQRSDDREEQVNSDRLPPRRGKNLTLSPRISEPQPRYFPQQPSRNLVPFEVTPMPQANKANKPWQGLDRALRTTDLLLQGGGFNTIVLDLGNVEPEVAWRIPLATWFRFRAACERTRVSLLLLTQHSCARSSAGLVVRLQTGNMETDGRVMTGIRYRGQAERSRGQHSDKYNVALRKPPQAEHAGQWVSEAAWMQPK